VTGPGSAGTLRVRSERLLAPVLERVVAALGARVDLPIDRLSDAQLVASALAAAARRQAPGGALSVDLTASSGAIGLSVGPLPAGAAARLVADTAVPGLGPVLERLADRWEVVAGDGGTERLDLSIGRPSGVSPAGASRPDP
jgi:hypothetical protein